MVGLRRMWASLLHGRGVIQLEISIVMMVSVIDCIECT